MWVDTRVHGDLSEPQRRALSRSLARGIEQEFGVTALVEITALP